MREKGILPKLRASCPNQERWVGGGTRRKHVNSDMRTKLQVTYGGGPLRKQMRDRDRPTRLLGRGKQRMLGRAEKREK